MKLNPTSAEEIAWQKIRNLVPTIKFEKQWVMQPYIVDFYCSAARLIVEVDGKIHEKTKEYDKRRDDYFLKKGIKTIRIPAALVFQRCGKTWVMVKQEVINRMPEFKRKKLAKKYPKMAVKTTQRKKLEEHSNTEILFALKLDPGNERFLSEALKRNLLLS